MEPDKPKLDYSPPIGWQSRRRRRTLIVTAIVIWIGLGCYWLWVGYLGDRVAFWYWQRQAEQYSLPPGTPVYTTDPALAGKLLNSGRGYDSSNVAAALHPRVWRQVSEYSGAPHSLDAPLFLHRRTRPDGVDRLVAVRPRQIATYAFSSPTASWAKWTFNIQPLTFWAGATNGPHLLCVESVGPALEYTSDDRVTFFAGQIDPTFASHFTIAYAINGRSGTLDGWLQNDDSVRLVARDGPLKH